MCKITADTRLIKNSVKDHVFRRCPTAKSSFMWLEHSRKDAAEINHNTTSKPSGSDVKYVLPKKLSIPMGLAFKVKMPKFQLGSLADYANEPIVGKGHCLHYCILALSTKIYEASHCSPHDIVKSPPPNTKIIPTNLCTTNLCTTSLRELLPHHWHAPLCMLPYYKFPRQ